MSEAIPVPASPLRLPEDVVPLLPMRNVVLFPHVLTPVALGRPRSIAALQHAVAGPLPVALVLQKDMQLDEPGFDGLFSVGTLATRRPAA